MGSVIIDVSMSIDGFVAGPNDSDRAPLGGAYRPVSQPEPTHRSAPGPYLQERKPSA